MYQRVVLTDSLGHREHKNGTVKKQEQTACYIVVLVYRHQTCTGPTRHPMDFGTRGLVKL